MDNFGVNTRNHGILLTQIYEFAKQLQKRDFSDDFAKKLQNRNFTDELVKKLQKRNFTIGALLVRRNLILMKFLLEEVCWLIY